MWRKWLDPHVKVITTQSSSFLPIVVTLPDCLPSVHIAVYMPTHGQDTEFVSELASLKNCLDCLNETYNYPCIYIRGDANVNNKNTTRVNILTSFMDNFNLTRTNIEHRTYHHFVGEGQFDSNLDVILHSAGKYIPDMVPEWVTGILCQKSIPSMHSHHDAILSCFVLPQGDTEVTTDDCITAPRLDTQRTRIIGSEEGIQEYSFLVSGQLRYIRDTWLYSQSQASMSILLQLTNHAMNSAAAVVNKSITLTTKTHAKKNNIPKPIYRAKLKLNKIYRKLKSSQDPKVLAEFKLCRKKLSQGCKSTEYAG